MNPWQREDRIEEAPERRHARFEPIERLLAAQLHPRKPELAEDDEPTLIVLIELAYQTIMLQGLWAAWRRN